MGGANNICSDKTGTLTKNLMTVTRIFVQESSTSNIDESIMKRDTCELLSIGVCVNSTACPKVTKSTTGHAHFEQIGNKTECALLEMADKFGYSYAREREGAKDKIKMKFPFSSKKKKMTTVYEKNPKQYWSFTKGAPDFIVENCTRYINKDGKVVPIDDRFLDLIKRTISDFAN